MIGNMSEEAVKNYFKAIAKHITNKSYILGTLDCFESDEELDIMTKLLSKSPKMSTAEIELTILEKIVNKRKRKETE